MVNLTHMKLGLNLTREPLGGITSANMALIDYLYEEGHDFLGIELNGRLVSKHTRIYDKYEEDRFDHYVINIHDLGVMDVIKKTKDIDKIRKKYKKVIQTVEDLLNKNRPDVILLNGTYYIPWIISEAAKKLDIPYVLWYAGVLSKEVEHYDKEFKEVFKIMEKDITLGAEAIIYPSEICRDTVKKIFSRRKLPDNYVIPNPVNDIFTEAEVGDTVVEKSIAAVGRYARVKNFDAFFNIHRDLLGDGWKHKATFVSDISNANTKFPETMELVPPMSAEGLLDFYKSQGLIVCPSYFETFGYVPVEAICVGVPVLVNHTVGCAQLLIDAGLENMVADFKNHDEVITKIKKLCGRKVSKVKINNIRAQVKTDLVCAKMLSVIQSAVNKFEEARIV